MPSVDLIIPTYNALPARLDRAVASGLKTSWIARVLVVDDGSSPPAQPSAASDGRVQLVRMPANAGPSAARNGGLDLSQAEFVVLLDDDDELLTGAKQAMDLATHLRAAAVVSARLETTEQGRTRRRTVPAAWADRVLPAPSDVFTPIALFGASGMVIGPQALKAKLRFDEALRVGEDREFLRRVADIGPIGVCAETALRVTLHTNADNLTSAANFSRRVRDFLAILARHHNAQSDAHFNAAAHWLLNQLSKSGTDDESWDLLRAAFREHGWAVPLKPRLRRLLRRPRTARM